MNTDLNLDEINKAIADRSNVFYWQTDRKVTPEEAGKIWADRHRYFTDNELIKRVNEKLRGETLVELEPLNLEAQTNLGNVNSVRTGKLKSGKEIIIRCHPKGIVNGYFYAESAAAERTKTAGLPSYETLAIHEFQGADDFSFQAIEKLPGRAIKHWLTEHPDDEDILLPKIGAMMARVHKISVEGFGPFDNDKAGRGRLVGLHDSQAAAVQAGLKFNIDVLEKEKIIKAGHRPALLELFDAKNSGLACKKPNLIHNDFADWNLLTDGHDVTGILDWDECAGGDPILDIACWSTFFAPERLSAFLTGYFSVAKKADDFQAKFELFRLRYVLSKMTLRVRRYTWEPSEEVRQKIEIGKIHLAKSMKYFHIV